MHYGRMRLYGNVGSADTKLGKGSINANGYRVVFKNGKHALEHRWIMQQHLNRELLPHENVHHINGDKLDNQLDNLELWSTSQPSGQRIADKTAWAIEWLRQYAPETLNQERD